MTTISYAQNFEDVILLRALGNMSCGFYIDVGAQHPIHGSVTKAFYERGWRGINIEPVAQWFGEVVKDRPEDINLKIAISDTDKELELYEVPDTGLSTTAERYAAKHRDEGRTVIRRTVACRKLDDVIADYVTGDIHVLKIDVEGAEGSVLKSISLDRHRPWIMVIEATEPNSQEPAYSDWEPRLLQSGYEMVYEDGLNRFYLAAERAELKGAFRLPPNYFDFFIPYSEWCTRKELELQTVDLATTKEMVRTFHEGAALGEIRQRLLQQRALHRLASREQRKLQEERDKLQEECDKLQEGRDKLIETEARAAVELRMLQAQLHELQAERDELAIQLEQSAQVLDAANIRLAHLVPCERAMLLAESELALVKRSHSWRLTLPLRAMRSAIRGTPGMTRRVVRATCRDAARILVRVPGARPVARGLFARSPKLKQRVLGLIYGTRQQQVLDGAPPADARAQADSQSELSRSANEALELLKRHRDSKQRARQGPATY